MPLKIAFFSMDTAGHLNACIGLGQTLLKRDHRVVFLLNAANKGKASVFGFEEILLHLAHPEPKPPIKEFAAMILASGILGPGSPLEKLRHNTGKGQGKWSAKLFSTLVEFNPQIEKAIAELEPDVILVDHWLIPPAIIASGIPWVFVLSGGPLGLYRSDLLPPSGSGFPINSDRAEWLEFRELHFAKFTMNFITYQRKLFEQFNVPFEDLYRDSIIAKSKYLNLYGYPKELDYADIAQLEGRFFRLDSYSRELPLNPVELPLPEHFRNRVAGQSLIYFSLGTLGSVDVVLMKRITSALAKTPHLYIVSKGPLADEYDLPPNCWGAEYLPQPDILPLVDLVITHGGNNTVTETLAMGKPMIVMPLFGDQWDNAIRIEQQGFGCRLLPYTFENQELWEAIERLLADKSMRKRLDEAVARIKAAHSKVEACKQIEALVDAK